MNTVKKNIKLRAFILPCLLIFISAVFIFFRFDQLPKYLALDELELAKLALSLKGKPYISFSPLADGHPTLYFYIILLSFQLLGTTKFALRLPIMLFGITNVILIFHILKKFFSDKLAFLLSFVFLTLHWYLNFVRFSFEMPFLLMLELIALYFLQNDLLIGSAIFSGLAFNSYQPGRIFFLIPLFILLLNKKPLRTILTYLFIFLLMITPVSVHLLTNSEQDIRIGQQLFLKNPNLTLAEKLNGLRSNIGKTALMFNISGDLNGRHNYPGKPALNPILSLMFVVGLGIALYRFSQFPNSLFLIYFFIALIPTLLTNPIENPHMLRTFTVLPSVIYFVGLTIQSILSLKIFHKKVPYVFLGIVLILILSTIYELRTYFIYQAQVFPYAFEIRGVLKDVLK